jgi:molybdopterin-guanine dinucleotide biosynthesis protein A
MTKIMNNLTNFEVTGVILAGGQSRRFGGGDKFHNMLNGKSILSHVIERVHPQVSRIIINSNSDVASFKNLELSVIADTVQGYVGPLAGILTGMEWALENFSECKWIATFPADAPFIPLDCIGKMKTCAEQNKVDVVCAASGGRTHPVCALWRIDLANELRLALVNEEIRKIDLWTARHRLATVEFSDKPFDPFFNINRLKDLELAEKISQNLK